MSYSKSIGIEGGNQFPTQSRGGAQGGARGGAQGGAQGGARGGAQGGARGGARGGAQGGARGGAQGGAQGGARGYAGKVLTPEEQQSKDKLKEWKRNQLEGVDYAGVIGCCSINNKCLSRVQEALTELGYPHVVRKNPGWPNKKLVFVFMQMAREEVGPYYGERRTLRISTGHKWSNGDDETFTINPERYYTDLLPKRAPTAVWTEAPQHKKPNPLQSVERYFGGLPDLQEGLTDEEQRKFLMSTWIPVGDPGTGKPAPWNVHGRPQCKKSHKDTPSPFNFPQIKVWENWHKEGENGPEPKINWCRYWKRSLYALGITTYEAYTLLQRLWLNDVPKIIQHAENQKGKDQMKEARLAAKSVGRDGFSGPACGGAAASAPEDTKRVIKPNPYTSLEADAGGEAEAEAEAEADGEDDDDEAEAEADGEDDDDDDEDYEGEDDDDDGEAFPTLGL